MRILIVRTRALGDTVHALPVACAIKDAFPGAHVGWLVEDWASAMLDGHPAVDARIVVPRGWSRKLDEWRKLRHAFAAAPRYDVALELQGHRATTLAALASNAPRRIGFTGMISHEWHWLDARKPTQDALSRAIAWPLGFEVVAATREQITDRFLQILEPLGIRDPAVRFGLREASDDARAVEGLLRELGLDARPFAVVFPGGDEHKRWPPERFAELGRHLGVEHGLRTLVVQGLSDAERDAAQRVVDGSQGHAMLLAPMTIRRIASLARRAHLFVAGDTGLLHIAAATGARCVALVGHALAARFRPHGSANRTVAGTPVPFHLARHGGRGVEAMRAIAVADVIRACDDALD